ncbi:uncharacterized protein LOC124471855 [Hypomesus transpacificus]|uniref:uncharacterized protein LOC124471855 n=1 Tax=Hypomesus transpacificus TaxID=137520 RepID=UPI001F07D503|nr:uncharacterized protein LOC124471855 [Hypomesus transpacificus]
MTDFDTDWSRMAREHLTDERTPLPASVQRSRLKLCIILCLCIIATCVVMISLKANSKVKPIYASHDTCPGHLAKDALTPIDGSKHLMISAYKDYRKSGVTRILAIINKDHPTPLYCIFCCSGNRSKETIGLVKTNSVHYGYPYSAADVFCSEEPGCSVTHITLVTHDDAGEYGKMQFLTVQNKERKEEDFQFFLTVCMSSMFGNYNNILQFVQTMEFYKLFGVQKVFLYLTSCSLDMEKVLQYYIHEGSLEIIPWHITKFLHPSTGWKPEELEGDIHLNGQISVMNECFYRNMYSSRYVLLADVDQLVVPYQHTSLVQMLHELQEQNPGASVFQVETIGFSETPVLKHDKRPFSGPGTDLLEHVYRQPGQVGSYRSHKMVLNPRLVLQVAMFEVLQSYG